LARISTWYTFTIDISLVSGYSRGSPLMVDWLCFRPESLFELLSEAFNNHVLDVTLCIYVKNRRNYLIILQIDRLEPFSEAKFAITNSGFIGGTEGEIAFQFEGVQPPTLVILKWANPYIGEKSATFDWKNPAKYNGRWIVEQVRLPSMVTYTVIK
jgi:hypothetical protein